MVTSSVVVLHLVDAAGLDVDVGHLLVLAITDHAVDHRRDRHEHHLVHPLQAVAVGRVPVEDLPLHHPHHRVAVGADADELPDRGPAAEKLPPARRAEDDDLGAAGEVLVGEEAPLRRVEVVHGPVGGGGPGDVERLLEARSPDHLAALHRRLHELEGGGLGLQGEGVVVGESLRPLLDGVLLELPGVELADEHLPHAPGLVPELLALSPAAVDETEGGDHGGDAEDDPHHLEEAPAPVGVDVDDAVDDGVPEREQVPAQQP